MRLVSTAKAFGFGSGLFPDDKNFYDIQNDLFVAIEQAVRVLSWQENLVEDECPPSWMWHLDWEIEEWFKKLKKVKINRDKKYNVNSSAEEPEGSDWEENVLFERMKDTGSLFE